MTHRHVSSPACLWKGQESGIQRAFVPRTITGAWEELSQRVFHERKSGPSTQRDRGQRVGSRDIGAKDEAGKIKQKTKHLCAIDFMCDLGQVTLSLSFNHC